MPKLRVHNLTLSVDGYAAGPEQSVEHPLGVGGPRLHDWAFATRTFRRMFGQAGGSEDLDDEFARAGEQGIGATIMGRNMFGPVRGPWRDSTWRGWWGETPPFGHPVFVLTHHPHEVITMAGGTSFHFVTSGIEAALALAFDAADGADVRLGGGATTVQEYLRVGLIDELHLAIAPVLLGRGERLFDHLDGGPDGYDVVGLAASPAALHVRLARTGA